MAFKHLANLTLRKTVTPTEVDPDLVQSIKDKGFLPNPCILVRKNTVVDGNRRITALRSLSPEERNKALARFNGKVPVIIIT